MGAALQKKVLETLHYALRPTGYLYLGKSESLGGNTNLFSVADRKHKIYSRKPVVGSAQLGARSPDSARTGQLQIAASAAPKVFDVRREAERILVEQYAPAALVVDPDLYIVHFHGDTSPYLAPAAGDPSFHLLRMVRPELLVDLVPRFNDKLISPLWFCQDDRGYVAAARSRSSTLEIPRNVRGFHTRIGRQETRHFESAFLALICCGRR